ncbi:YeeE/YedE family protein [Gilvibacter sediminis]|uniref:YeeE/YedE family protein n=1 Tax=Gilvibacter sediminis TaxID=379071 RepID=UPI0023503318|nr:YeeE/YedE thiosulfate transporter family protein [Gilvibacter sediminis]MDC7997369.1 YeeE/YedE thiosulfate transporter family protein [Gilvibacter sediminis]
MNIFMEPWPWYISGILITGVMALLLWGNKSFGVSGNFRTLCTLCGANKKASFFKFDWRAQRWNLWVMVGTILGGFIGANFLSNDSAVSINESSVEKLQQIGATDAGKAYLPEFLFGTEALTEPKSLALLIIGGFLVGFGARYAGGCTSGHAISGLSNLQLPSLLAVMGFFIGGLVMVHLIFPILF